MGKKNALGRGLNAILQSPDTDITSKDISGEFVAGAVAEISLNLIEANPFQPRDEFSQESLNSLAESIKLQGVIQPVTVRKMGYDKYQLISGERRYRACQLAEIEVIPAYIRIADDQQMVELALIENVHREDLNAIEVALSYHRMMEECGMQLNDIVEKISQNRSTVTNYLRLLKLPPEAQIAVRDGQISMGHARAIISIEDPKKQLELLEEIIISNLSVRDVEKRVKSLKGKTSYDKKQKSLPEFFANERVALTESLKTKIKVSRNSKGRGNIVISFDSDESFREIVEKIKGNLK